MLQHGNIQPIGKGRNSDIRKAEKASIKSLRFFFFFFFFLLKQLHIHIERVLPVVMNKYSGTSIG